MPAITSRKESRQRLLELFQKSVDRIIPEDDSVPLRGQTFRDFEDQAEELRRAILPALLEERAALEETALVESGGACPFCESDRVYLSGKPQQREVTSPQWGGCAHASVGQVPVLWPIFFPRRAERWD